MNTFPIDGYYGHSTILAWHCGLSHPRPILGQLQHGWICGTHLSGEEQGGWITGGPLALAPKLVWSRADARSVVDLFDRVNGRGPVTAIGAPFAYLVELLGGRSALLAQATGRRGTLAFPAHSHPGLPAAEGHCRFAEALARQAEPPVTVCLFVTDYLNRQVRQIYERNGLAVVTNGQRSDPLFLIRLLRAVLSHRRTVGNVLTSGHVYAAYLGAEVETWDDPNGSPFAAYANCPAQAALLPRLVLDKPLTADEALDWGSEQLGQAEMLGADELAQVLGWRGVRQAVALAAAAGLALRRRLRAGYWDTEPRASAPST